jgi:hypothetical protein
MEAFWVLELNAAECRNTQERRADRILEVAIGIRNWEQLDGKVFTAIVEPFIEKKRGLLITDKAQACCLWDHDLVFGHFVSLVFSPVSYLLRLLPSGFSPLSFINTTLVQPITTGTTLSNDLSLYSRPRKIYIPQRHEYKPISWRNTHDHIQHQWRFRA